MKRMTLVIIFNHKYDKNIPLLREMYENRFSSIIFLVPFYSGSEDDVISVYESSYYFQGYIAQAYNQIRQRISEYYIFIGDDLIINPTLNENNLIEALTLTKGDGYIESMTRLNDTDYWPFSRFYDIDMAFQSKGVNYKNELPSIEEAKRKAEEFGFKVERITKNVKSYHYPMSYIKMNFRNFALRMISKVNIEYPMVTGYSDFFVISSDKLEDFARISGVFAAMGVFVEAAIPTTLMLIYNHSKLKMQKDIEMLTPKLWWITDIATDFEKKCNYCISNMKEYWPSEYVYLHPIKLSKWKLHE